MLVMRGAPRNEFRVSSSDLYSAEGKIFGISIQKISKNK